MEKTVFSLDEMSERIALVKYVGTVLYELSDDYVTLLDVLGRMPTEDLRAYKASLIRLATALDIEVIEGEVIPGVFL